MAELASDPLLMVGKGWDSYRLLDSGEGRKLEAYGPHLFIRPEPQAMWSPRLADWRADGEFVPGSDEDGGGRWQLSAEVPQAGWELRWGDGVRFTAQCTPFRHLGFFPDMAPVWQWMGAQLGDRSDAETLNLFGYTGAASLACARAGAKVTHVDASKKAIAQARENQALSGMESAPIRWIADDALAFVRREARRGNSYDGVILDPPKHGRGPEGEVWKLEQDFGALLEALTPIVAPPATT